MADVRMGEEKFTPGLGKTARPGQARRGIYLGRIERILPLVNGIHRVCEKVSTGFWHQARRLASAKLDCASGEISEPKNQYG
jgi:hypothetical protein